MERTVGSGTLSVPTSQVAVSRSAAIAALAATQAPTTGPGWCCQPRRVERVSAQPRTRAMCSVLICR